VQAAGYLKLGDIKGEATDRDHKEWIIIESFSHALHQTDGGATGATRRRASATVEDIVVSKSLDKSSPKLAETVANGKILPSAELHFVSHEGDGSSEPYLVYVLTNVLVTSYSVSGGADDRPTEQVSFNFEKIEMKYVEKDEEGGIKGFVTWVYDLVRAK
jgi:type VI secretion system secreted protein Hcp